MTIQKPWYITLKQEKTTVCMAYAEGVWVFIEQRGKREVAKRGILRTKYHIFVGNNISKKIYKKKQTPDNHFQKGLFTKV